MTIMEVLENECNKQLIDIKVAIKELEKYKIISFF